MLAGDQFDPRSYRLARIDDHVAILPYEKVLLEGCGHAVTAVTAVATVHQGPGLATSRKFDAVFLNYEMPGAHGCDVAFEIKRARPERAVLLLSGSKVPTSHIGRMWSRTLASLLPFGFLLSGGALQIPSSSPITQVEPSPGRQYSSLAVPPPGRT